jgi:hypothetical protein
MNETHAKGTPWDAQGIEKAQVTPATRAERLRLTPATKTDMALNHESSGYNPRRFFKRTYPRQA